MIEFLTSIAVLFFVLLLFMGIAVAFMMPFLRGKNRNDCPRTEDRRPHGAGGGAGTKGACALRHYWAADALGYLQHGCLSDMRYSAWRDDMRLWRET